MKLHIGRSMLTNFSEIIAMLRTQLLVERSSSTSSVNSTVNLKMERLSAIPRSNAARLSAKHLGSHQQSPGIPLIKKTALGCNKNDELYTRRH